jgi:hypothetical protein
MDVQTDERLLINIEGYLIELVCNVESMDELNLVAEALEARGLLSLRLYKFYASRNRVATASRVSAKRCLRLSKRRQNLRVMIVLRENAIPWNVSFSAKLSTTTILLSPVIRHHPMCTESFTSEVANKVIKPSSWSA